MEREEIKGVEEIVMPIRQILGIQEMVKILDKTL